MQRLSTPVPGKQLVDAAGGMFGDTGEDVSQPGLWIDVVQLGRDDEAVEDAGALAAAVGAGKQPGLSAESQTAQGALGGIGGEADPGIVEEAGKDVPTLQHVIHGDGDVGVTRQLAAFLAHPRFERGDHLLRHVSAKPTEAFSYLNSIHIVSHRSNSGLCFTSATDVLRRAGGPTRRLQTRTLGEK